MTAQITSVKLSDAIDLLRDDLVEAIEAAKRDHAAKGANPLTFEVTSTEVELSVALTKEGTAGAKLTWSVIPAILSGEGSVQAKLAHSETHKVKLSLKPLYRGSTPYVSRQAESPSRDPNARDR